MNAEQGMTVRAYRDDQDRDRLADIWLAASRVGHPFFVEKELLDQQAEVRNVYLRQAENWVFEDGGRQMGFIGLIDNFIGGLFVDPSAHGGGFGKALVLHAAALKGALDVEIYAANVRAIGFYRRLGFIEVSRGSQDEGGTSLEVVVMHRPAPK
jgi:putative acetyltransferase